MSTSNSAKLVQTQYIDYSSGVTGNVTTFTNPSASNFIELEVFHFGFTSGSANVNCGIYDSGGKFVFDIYSKNTTTAGEYNAHLSSDTVLTAGNQIYNRKIIIPPSGTVEVRISAGTFSAINFRAFAYHYKMVV